jgi:hypothetical protein
MDGVEALHLIVEQDVKLHSLSIDNALLDHRLLLLLLHLLQENQELLHLMELVVRLMDTRVQASYHVVLSTDGVEALQVIV